MQIPDRTSVAGEVAAAGLSLDPAQVITHLASVREARALPPGSIVGDLQGGLTFSDAIAAALEARSLSGWREVHAPGCETWTIIVVDK